MYASNLNKPSQGYALEGCQLFSPQCVSKVSSTHSQQIQIWPQVEVIPSASWVSIRPLYFQPVNISPDRSNTVSSLPLGLNIGNIFGGFGGNPTHSICNLCCLLGPASLPGLMLLCQGCYDMMKSYATH